MQHQPVADLLYRSAFPPITENPNQEAVVRYSKAKHLMENNTTDAEVLFDRTMQSIQAEFDKRCHILNPAQLASLEEAVGVMVAMANATANSAVSLSSLDPGVGKTTTYIQFTRNLVCMTGYADVGVLICLPRLEEVRRLVLELGLDPSKVAIKTSSLEVNALSTAGIHDAQVLITTHEQVKRLCKRHTGFSEVDCLYYQGQPRQVRIWDEAYVPRQAIQVSSDDINALIAVLRSACPAVAALLHKLNERLIAAPSGPFEVGQVTADFSPTVMEDAWSVVGKHSTHEDTLQRLTVLEGGMARKANDNTAVATLFSCSQVIPPDFAPALVFDASGRVRKTYTALEQNGDLRRLSAAPKDYSTVDVHLHKIASSRSSWRERWSELVDYVAGIMKSNPSARYLIIAHKDIGARKLKSDLEKAAPGVKFDLLRWGQHQATNEYADYDHIIVASTFFIPEGAYEALAYAALGLDVSQPLPEGFLTDLIQGELADMLFQGVCRGALRGCVEGKAIPCKVHILASARSQVQQLVPTIFPGCKLKIHAVQKPKQSTAVNRATEYCEKCKAQSATFIPIADLMEACGINDRSNFNKQVVNNASFQAYVETAGLLAFEGQRAGSICGYLASAFPPVGSR